MVSPLRTQIQGEVKRKRGAITLLREPVPDAANKDSQPYGALEQGSPPLAEGKAGANLIVA